jgi:hypothetical protein
MLGLQTGQPEEDFSGEPVMEHFGAGDIHRSHTGKILWMHLPVRNAEDVPLYALQTSRGKNCRPGKS